MWWHNSSFTDNSHFIKKLPDWNEVVFHFFSDQGGGAGYLSLEEICNKKLKCLCFTQVPMPRETLHYRDSSWLLYHTLLFKCQCVLQITSFCGAGRMKVHSGHCLCLEVYSNVTLDFCCHVSCLLFWPCRLQEELNMPGKNMSCHCEEGWVYEHSGEGGVFEYVLERGMLLLSSHMGQITMLLTLDLFYNWVHGSSAVVLGERVCLHFPGRLKRKAKSFKLVNLNLTHLLQMLYNETICRSI